MQQGKNERQIITSHDVQDAARSGDGCVRVAPQAIVTDEAREAAVRFGVEIVTTDEPVYSEPPRQESEAAGIELQVSPRSDALITGGTVAIPGDGLLQADLVVADGKIAALGRGISCDGRRIDASGLMVMPGVFDPHVHLGLFAPSADELVSEGRSALSGGVTCLGWFIDGEGSHQGRLREEGEKVRQHAPVDVVPHLVISQPEQLAEVQEYISQGVRSFKVYMCGLPGLIEPVDDAFIADLFEKLAPYGDEVVVCVHAENSHLVRRARARLRAREGPVDSMGLTEWAEAHPEVAEEEAIGRAAVLGRRWGIQVYFVHVSSRAGLRAVRRARKEGGCVWAETTSPYLTAPPTGEQQALGKMVPPLRGEETADALWKALADGTLDTVGTDNVTITKQQKGIGGPLGEVIPGYPALGTHLPILLHEGYHKRGVDLMRIIEAVTRNPADIFGLYPQKGTLLPGSDADCAVVDLTKQQKVKPENLQSRSDFSPVEGRTLRGWPVMTMKGGQITHLFGRPQRSGSAGCMVLPGR